jgi:hypothetical protein
MIKMMGSDPTFMLRLREALEASWDGLTAYGATEKAGNPALGQCYPTAWVVQRLDRHNLGDSRASLERCALLLKRVEAFLNNLP